jgi:anti-sigma B factor antagonist
MPQEPLTIEDIAGLQNGERILRLKGPILINNLFDFQAKVRANQSEKLILDLTEVSYVDSAGIGALVGAYVTHHMDGRSLALVGVSDRLRHALQVTHVEHFFRFFPSVSDAQSAVA